MNSMDPIFGWQKLKRTMNMYNLPKFFILQFEKNNLKSKTLRNGVSLTAKNHWTP